jgi:DNA-binding CsgD family transcriptional regulator
VPPTVARQRSARAKPATPTPAALADPPAPGGHRPAEEPVLASDTIQLAHELLRLASGEAPAAGAGDEAVMLDLHAHGLRCLLIVEADNERPPRLSPREQEIVRMVSQGYPNKTIAAVLDISTWTVSTHLRRIFAKLGVRTRAAMVARAIDLKMVAPPRHG